MGFVKIPDDLSEWAWYGDNNTLAVYIRLLLGAAWKETDYKNAHLRRGQIAVTTARLAAESGLSVQRVRTVLERLRSTGKITIETTTKFSIITLNEYDVNVPDNKQNNNRTTNEQQANNNQTTSDQQTYIISNRSTEDKKVRRSEVTADAASASPTAASSNRDSLIESFGRENVDEYEKRYDSWKAKKGGKVRGERYETIRRMMEQDGVRKPVGDWENSSFDLDAVRERILRRYARSG